MLSLEINQKFYENDLIDVYNIVKNYKDLFDIHVNNDKYYLCDYKVNIELVNDGFFNDDDYIFTTNDIKLILKIYEKVFDMIFKSLSQSNIIKYCNLKEFIDEQIKLCIKKSSDLINN